QKAIRLMASRYTILRQPTPRCAVLCARLISSGDWRRQEAVTLTSGNTSGQDILFFREVARKTCAWLFLSALCVLEEQNNLQCASHLPSMSRNVPGAGLLIHLAA